MEEGKEIQKAQIHQLPRPEIKEGTPEELDLLKCPKCGHIHFRHAGYVEVALPYSDRTGHNVALTEKQVKVCVKCRTCVVSYDGKVWDITKFIDLKAWEAFEVEAQKAVGPGGNC